MCPPIVRALNLPARNSLGHRHNRVLTEVVRHINVSHELTLPTHPHQGLSEVRVERSQTSVVHRMDEFQTPSTTVGRRPGVAPRTPKHCFPRVVVSLGMGSGFKSSNRAQWEAIVHNVQFVHTVQGGLRGLFTHNRPSCNEDRTSGGSEPTDHSRARLLADAGGSHTRPSARGHPSELVALDLGPKPRLVGSNGTAISRDGEPSTVMHFTVRLRHRNPQCLGDAPISARARSSASMRNLGAWRSCATSRLLV